MAVKLNFWEEFAINTGIGALQILINSTNLSSQQKADVEKGLADLQQISADFSIGQ